MFTICAREQELISSVLIPSGHIRNRCDRLAQQIFDDYKGKTLHILVILTGAYQFFFDLNTSLQKLRAMRNPATEDEDVICHFYFSKAKSYDNDESTGEVKFTVEDSAITDAHVLILEDIFDSGLTMKKIVDTLKTKGAKSVRSCVLLHKRNEVNLQYSSYFSDYIGFFIPNSFIVGYGLDYNNQMRDLEHICVISEHAKSKFRK